VCLESCVTNSQLPVMGNLHGRPRHLSAQSAKSNIMKLSARGSSRTNLVMRIPRHGGDAKIRVHLRPNDSDRLHQNWPRIYVKRHLFHLVTMRQLTYPKSKVCHPDICIYILLLSVLNFEILMHTPRITSVIKILIQICWLMKEHPLVSTLSAAW